MSFADRSLSGSAYTGSSSSQSTRQGSTDPYALSRLRHDTSEHQRTADLTAEALERLRVSDDPHPMPGAGRQARGPLRRQASLTPSVTSVSTGPDEEDGRPSSRQTERYMKDQWFESGQGKGKGKGKEREDVQGTTVHDLPGEVLISVRHLYIIGVTLIGRYSAICQVKEMLYPASKSVGNGANSLILSYGNDRSFATYPVWQVSPESSYHHIRHSLTPNPSDESISQV